jgi:DNA-binding NarL/FixJ family response regulator
MRLAIVAPTMALRAGLRALLTLPLSRSAEIDDRLDVVFEAGSLGEFVDQNPRIDVLVIDGDLMESGRLSSLSAREEGQLAVLVLSDTQSHARMLAVESFRGWGILSLDASAGELQAAIHAVGEGLLVGSPNLLNPLLPRQTLTGDAHSVQQAERLTEREAQVLELLALGLANKQIALRLKISDHTVKFHISSIYAKLGVTNRTEAVRVGVQQGLVSL